MQTATLAETLTPRCRLNLAVHQHRALSPSGIQERLFTLMFSGLVYPQIWEDPDVDLEALVLTPSSHVVTIASGGCNVMNYLAEGPARISAVDLNPAHVALTRLKLAAAAHLPTYESFHTFFAEADRPENIDTYWTHISPHLDAVSRAYWEKRSAFGHRRISLFRRNFYRFGLLGRFIGAAHLAARLLGVDFSELMRAQSLEEQRAFFDSRIAPIFEIKLFRWFVDQPVSLFGLGIPPSQFVSLAEGRNMCDVLRERLKRLICDFPLNQNYFAWQAFDRRYKSGESGPLPRYLQRANFAALKSNARRAQVLNQSLTEFLEKTPNRSVDSFVLLDAQDWMTNSQLNLLWKEVTRTAKSGARVIFRTAGSASILPGRLDDETLVRWHYHDTESRILNARDRSSIYGGFHQYSLSA